jgi:hypothetical protein
MKDIMQIPEATVQKWVYAITIPMALISGISAIIFVVLLQQGPALVLFKVFAGVMGFIAIYSIQISKAIQWKKKDGDE